MVARETVTKKAAREVLGRMQKGDKHTLQQEAKELGLSGTGPLKEALEAACGGKAGYRDMMGARRYPRRSAAERTAAAERKVADVKRTLLAAGVKKVVLKKVVAPASKKKREAGVVAVEFDDGSAAADDDEGGTDEDEAGGGGTDDDEAAEVVDCVDALSDKGWDWANEYWGAGASEANATGKAPGLL